MSAQCLRCAKPVADGGYVCSRCWLPLERDLGDMTFLAEQLDITLSRQSRTAPRAYGSRSSDTPVYFDVTASSVGAESRAVLVSWALMVSEERGIPTPADRLAAMGVFLLGQQEWLRHHPAASDALEELTAAIHAIRNAVDTAPDMLVVGPCDPKGEHGDPCTQELRVKAGKEFVECAACGLSWRVADRREFLVEAAQDMLVTAYVLSRFLTAYGDPISDDRLRKWAAQGHIVSHGTDPRGNPLYRVSEAAEVLSRINELRRKKVS